MIVFWDVDGTLVANATDGIDLYAQAVTDTLGTPVVNPPPRHGKTDRQILREYLTTTGGNPGHLGRATERLEELSQVRYLTPRTARTKLPGCVDALRAVRQIGGTSALLTGNSATRAAAKLTGAGIELSWFDWPTSLFGDTYPDRPSMARAARRLTHHAVVVGDTPGDGAAANTAEFPFIAVTTGAYGPDELSQFTPVGTFDNLQQQLANFTETIRSLASHTP